MFTDPQLGSAERLVSYSPRFTILGDTTRSYSPSASFSADAISVGDDAIHPPISDVIPSEVITENGQKHGPHMG